MARLVAVGVKGERGVSEGTRGLRETHHAEILPVAGWQACQVGRYYALWVHLVDSLGALRRGGHERRERQVSGW